MIQLFDIGIDISISLLLYLYSTIFFVFVYIAIMSQMNMSNKHCIIPAGLRVFMCDLIYFLFRGGPMNVLTGIVIIVSSIVPISLIWPLSYPIIWIGIKKYQKSQRFIDLCSSV